MIACGGASSGGASSRSYTCDDAAGGIVKAIMATAGDGAVPGEVIDRMNRAIADSCAQSAWSAASIQCFATAADPQAMDGCGAQLDATQQNALVQSLGGAMPDAGGGGESGRYEGVYELGGGEYGGGEYGGGGYGGGGY